MEILSLITSASLLNVKTSTTGLIFSGLLPEKKDLGRRFYL